MRSIIYSDLRLIFLQFLNFTYDCQTTRSKYYNDRSVESIVLGFLNAAVEQTPNNCCPMTSEGVGWLYLFSAFYPNFTRVSYCLQSQWEDLNSIETSFFLSAKVTLYWEWIEINFLYTSISGIQKSRGACAMYLRNIHRKRLERLPRAQYFFATLFTREWITMAI